MKKIYIITVLSFLFFTSRSQDFLGISTGNFSGVSGVMLQPASIVDSRYKFDINLFSTSINYSNNYFLVNRDALLKFNKNSFSDYQTFKARYLSEASLTAGERVFLNINNRTQVPLSFMATIGKKSAIALNIQSRSMIQGRGITQELAKMAYNGFYSPSLNNNTIDASGFNLKALNWAEVGFTYGRVLYASDKHFFKAAFTGKYLAGVASINMGSNDIRFSVNNDSSMNFNTNRFDYNHNKNADFDMTFDKNFSPDASAFGFDAGMVYEYRGNFQKFKYIRNDDEKSYLADRRDVNKYIFKLGVSLLDVGMFRFNNPDNVNSFSANITNWNVASANYNTLRDFDTALANRVVALPGARFYNTYLPAALSVQFDLRFVKGFYLNAMAYRPVSIGKDAGQRFNRYGFYTITPRWESRQIGVYIPYTISDKNSLTNYRQNLLGATLRLGPLFIGSSNLGTMLFNKNLKAADVHVGLKIGITYGKPNKSSKYVERIFSKKADTPLPVITRSNNSVNDTVLIKKIDTVLMLKNDTSRLLIDYNKGKVYDNPNSKGNIIIVNNYYYGNAPTAPIKSDSASYQALAQYYNDLYQQRDSMLLQKNKAANDQNKKLIADSINYKKQQLDSLIQEMQILRIQMDSANIKDGTGASILPGNNESVINESSNSAGLQQRADTLVSETFMNSITDSMELVMGRDSLAGNNANIKKKSFDSSKARLVINDSVNTKGNVVPLLNDNHQQQDVKYQIVATPTADSMDLAMQMDSLAGNMAIIKKKGFDSSKATVNNNDRRITKSSAVPGLTDQQKDEKLQIVATPVADSMALVMRMDSLSGNNAFNKKNRFDSNNVRLAIKDTGTAKTASAVSLSNNNQKNVKPLNIATSAADSMAIVMKMDSLAATNGAIKKKSIDSSKATVAIKNTRTAKAGAVPDSKEKMQIVSTPAADQYNRQRILDQERLINEFRNETGRIRSDIARLQASAADNNRNYRRNNTLVPVLMPTTKKEVVFTAPPVRRDTIYIRDTLKQIDTIRITNTDTVRQLVTIPVIEKVTAKVAPSPVKVLRDTIVKQASFDYTAMPETVLLFGLGKAAVQKVYFKRLNFIAKVLLKEKLLQVDVTGHSDKSGSPEINRALSLKRAQNTSIYLLSKGVSGEQINTTAVSYLEPAMEGNTKNANSQNRRVVIKFEQRK